VWGRVRPGAWGLQARLTASYLVVTLAVVVLVETIVLGYQTPRLVDDTALRAPVAQSAADYAQELLREYPDGVVPPGVPLGEPGVPARPGHAQLTPDQQDLLIPAVSGPVAGRQALTAAVLFAPDGVIIASSAPSRYRPGTPAAHLLPAEAMTDIRARPKNLGSGSTPFGSVSWAVVGLFGSGTDDRNPPASLYVQAPQPTSSLNPVAAWNKLRRVSDAGAVLTASYMLLIAIVPTGALFGFLASRRLVRRVRRLEQATISVAGGDYTVTLPVSGRDEIGRLEGNFTAMTRQLDSALTAERQRAIGDARADERTRLAREIHDAISQHLFSLRMIAGGLRRADPGHPQIQAIEHITEEAIGDMQALLRELRPASLERAGLVPALEGMCEAYRSRLGVHVDSDLADLALPAAVEHALLRITQEAFTNAIRHGHARQLGVATTLDNGHVALTVRDTGAGFDPSLPHAGSGLRHIRERVTELGGTVEIASRPGDGATIRVRIPVP
jgi:signal transduction histidine kinase